MKIELKKLKISLAHSEETALFNADLVVNGITIGYAKNDGRGGCTYYHVYGKNDAEIKRNRQLMEQAEEHCLSLPPRTYTGLTISIPSNLEVVIDDLVEEEIQKKEVERINKKALKLQETNVIFGVRGKEVRAIGYGPNYKIAEMLKTTQGKELIGKLIHSALSKMEAGHEILNTNIDFSLTDFREFVGKLGKKAKTV